MAQREIAIVKISQDRGRVWLRYNGYATSDAWRKRVMELDVFALQIGAVYVRLVRPTRRPPPFHFDGVP